MNPSFKELLRQAELAQKERDQATQKLKEKRKKDEEDKRRALIDQFKRAKPAVSTRQDPVPNDVISARTIPKMTQNTRIDKLRRPLVSQSTLTTPTPLTANRASLNSSICKTPKSRVAPVNSKPILVGKAPPNIKPRASQPNMSFAEMMQLAQKNVNQGASPLDRPKPPQPAPPSTTALHIPSKGKCITVAQKCKLSPLPRDLPQTQRRNPITTAPSKRMHVSTAQNRGPDASSSRFIRSNDTTSKPKRYPAPKRSRYYSEDEADSMDDFIDDDGVDVEAEQELKSVVQKLCRSDKSTWKKRECEIDIAKMENSYRCVEMEEKRTAKIAFIEDKMEEDRGALVL